MAQNKDLVADAQTLLEENLSEKKSVESARRLPLCVHLLLLNEPCYADVGEYLILF